MEQAELTFIATIAGIAGSIFTALISVAWQAIKHRNEEPTREAGDAKTISEAAVELTSSFSAQIKDLQSDIKRLRERNGELQSRIDSVSAIEGEIEQLKKRNERRDIEEQARNVELENLRTMLVLMCEYIDYLADGNDRLDFQIREANMTPVWEAVKFEDFRASKEKENG